MIDTAGQGATMRPLSGGDWVESVCGTPFWLDLSPEPIYGVLHTPREGARTPVAALILPQFGWDDGLSYRSRRNWATSLAESGITATRIDFPGSEDSVGSPLAPNRVQSWIDATAQTALWLRERTGCDRLVAIGIGLGGLIAHQAIAANAPIDDLILWDVRSSGRAYVRELRAFAAIVAGEIDHTPEDTRADGVLWIAGHIMTAETADALSAINLADVPLPQAERRRVLLVGRDAHGVDEKLRHTLVESGAAVTVIDADDHFRLMAPPDYGWKPAKTISASIEWLQDSSSANLDPIQHAPAIDLPGIVDSVEFEYEGTRIREQVSELQTSVGRLVGIISEPTRGERAPYCLVVVSNGGLRHTAHSRMFVEMTRRAAASGVPAARFDLPGLGDSDGTWVRTFERGPKDDAHPLAAIKEIHDHLQELGIADRFIGAGLCLGGYFAIRILLEDKRSIGAIAANTPAFLWTDAHTRRAGRWSAAVIGAADPVLQERAKQRRASQRPSIAARAASALRAFEWRLGQRVRHIDLLWRFEHRAGIAAASETLDQLGRGGGQVLLLFAEDEGVLRMIDRPKPKAKLERWPNIVVERLPTRDHDLRPLRIQQVVLDRVSTALREFASATEGPVTPS
jgi:alpha-beta hydrolase superfamily lysophospholipase